MTVIVNLIERITAIFRKSDQVRHTDVERLRRIMRRQFIDPYDGGR